MAVLIRNGLIVTGDAAGTRHDPGDLVVEGDRIAWVGPAGQAPPDLAARVTETIPADRAIVMPGFVNAHMHSNEGFEQGAYDNLPLELWLLHSYPPFAMPRLTEREHYLRTMVCAVESIRSGVTTVQDDLLHTLVTPEAVDGAARAYTDAGLRAVVTVALWDRGFLDCLPFIREATPAALQAELEAAPPPGAAEQLALFERHHRTWQDHAGRIRIIPAPSGPQRCSDGLLESVADLSRSLDLPVHTHVLETRTQAVTAGLFYGGTMVEHLERVGLLSPRFTMNHAIWLTEGDIERLGHHGCSITHNPLSNQKLGSGICPVRKLLDAGVNVALGTDGLASSDTADMVQAIRAGSLLHKITSHDVEDWISADDVFRMATRGGARSTGFGRDVGSLEMGRKADLILLDRDSWGFIPLNDPVRQLAYSVTSEAVRTVLVDGRVVMRDRRILTVDEEALKAEVAALAEHFRRVHRPAMDAAAARLRPCVHEVHRRATALPCATANPRFTP